MRILIAVLFWVGLFLTVRECLRSRKHGLVITRTEKLYLATVLPFILGATLVLDLVGIAHAVLIPASVLATGVALHGWVIKRRIQRASGK